MTESGFLIPRERYMAIIRDYIDTPVIKALTGMRRSGKSFLLMLLKDELSKRSISSENILYLNSLDKTTNHNKRATSHWEFSTIQEETAMYSIGLDVHKTSTTACVLDEEGTVINTMKVKTSPEGLEKIVEFMKNKEYCVPLRR